jgi:hypothetical protein
MSFVLDVVMLPALASTMGVAGGVSVAYFYSVRFEKHHAHTMLRGLSSPNVLKSEFSDENSLQAKHLQEFDDSGLEENRSELKSLLLEKELASYAISRVAQAEMDGKISRPERDRLLLRYRHQISTLNGRISKLHALVEVAELDILKRELIQSFKDRINQIEERLEKIRLQLDQNSPEPEEKRQIGNKGFLSTRPMQTSGTSQSVSPTSSRNGDEMEGAHPKGTDTNPKIKQIQDEVLEALTKLEQIDVGE